MYPQIKFFVSVVITTVLLVSYACKGPEGDPGPQGATGSTGATGATGATGPTGSANVIQISYGSRIHTGAELSYTLTGMSAAQLNSSAFFTYVNPGNNIWYSLPGTTIGGSREYRTYVNPSISVLYINRVSGTGSETFTATRVVIIPASDLKNGRKTALDYSNYEEVKKRYNLPD